MAKTINMLTPVPGPISQEMLKKREKAVAGSAGLLTDIVVSHAHGSRVIDVDGNTFIDFSGGISVLNVGHTHPEVVKAIQTQAEKLTHTCAHVMFYEPYLELAEKINQLVPGQLEKKTMFANSGVEGIENAIKLARHFTGRPGIVCFEHAFHGRTLAGLSLTGKHSPYKRGFGPFLPEVYRMTFPYCYRCPGGLEPQNCKTICRSWIQNFFTTHVDPENVAAVVFEPILGEGGFLPFPPKFMDALVTTCRENGILMIADEIQTGWGRTGKLFAVEHYGVIPDILVTAKSIAGGMPLSSFTARAEIMDHPHVGGLGTTFGGNPVCCAAALAAIEVIQKEDLVTRANKVGKVVRDRFNALMHKFSIIGDVRGVGAMNAIELVSERSKKIPATKKTAQLVKSCWQNGLIILKAGSYGNCVRTLMPLVITDDELAEGLDVLEKVLASIG